jgi:hypothetical protein
MAIRISEIVWKYAPQYKGSKLLTLLALANHANDQAECWPSVELLARETRQCERSVQSALETLRKDGVLVQIRRGSGPGHSSRYRISLQSLQSFEEIKAAKYDTERLQNTTEKAVKGATVADEPSLVRTVRENRHQAQPAKKQQADSRFQPIVKHYLKRFEEVVKIKGRFDKADGKNLKELLRQHNPTPVEEITRWLDNAFDSTEQYPLKCGFRMTEFCRHYEKYVGGPLLKGHAGSRYPESKSPVPGTLPSYICSAEELRQKAIESRKDVAELAAELYGIGRQTFPHPRLAPLLDEFTAAELSGAYREFVANRDDFQMKRAVKDFCEGGAHDVILAQRKWAETLRRLDLGQQRVEQEQAAESAKVEEAQKEEEEQAKRAQQDLDKFLSEDSVECPATQ